jgi:hypothetical protein
MPLWPEMVAGEYALKTINVGGVHTRSCDGFDVCRLQLAVMN